VNIEIPECICYDSNVAARKDCPYCYPDAAERPFREHPTACVHGRFLTDQCGTCGHTRQVRLINEHPIGSRDNPCNCGNGDMLMPCEHWRAIGRTQ
jgi:hypothetical protein